MWFFSEKKVSRKTQGWEKGPQYMCLCVRGILPRRENSSKKKPRIIKNSKKHKTKKIYKKKISTLEDSSWLCCASFRFGSDFIFFFVKCICMCERWFPCSKNTELFHAFTVQFEPRPDAMQDFIYFLSSTSI